MPKPTGQHPSGTGSLEWRNWSGLQRCRPREVTSPSTEQDLAELLAASRQAVRVCGAGHSFAPLVPTDHTLIYLTSLAGIREVDGATRVVTCGGGTTIHDLGPKLTEHGLALPNQGDVDAQTIAGACSTGTHGTGPTFGCLATDIVGFRLVTADGQIFSCNRDQNPELFDAGRVSLGALGVLSELSIQCRDTFGLDEQITPMRWETCLEKSDELAEQNRHFEFFHFPYADHVLVKTMNISDRPPVWTTSDQQEDRLFRWACNFTRTFPVLNPGLQRMAMRWYPGRKRSGPSYCIFPSARTVRFNEMEYEVPAEAGKECYRELLSLFRQHRPWVCFPFEFRRVKGDSLWLSPFYERDSVSISIHQDWREPCEPLFRLLEPLFANYGGRPHWGKLHTLGAKQLQRLYPRWNDFQTLREKLDPSGKFLNAHLRKLWCA